MTLTDLDPTSVVADDADHTLHIVCEVDDPARFAEWQRVGRNCLVLEQCGLTHLIGDRHRGVCSCGATSPAYTDWQDARWWCRGHRTEAGLAWQQWLNEVRKLVTT